MWSVMAVPQFGLLFGIWIVWPQPGGWVEAAVLHASACPELAYQFGPHVRSQLPERPLQEGVAGAAGDRRPGLGQAGNCAPFGEGRDEIRKSSWQRWAWPAPRTKIRSHLEPGLLA